MTPPDVRGQAIAMAAFIDYADGSVVSKTLLDKAAGTLTLFSFDEGQGLSEHTSPYDATVLVVDGEVKVLYCKHAVLGNLEVVLLLLGLLFAKEALLFGLVVGIHLLNMFENDLGHVSTFRYAASR